MRNFHCVAKCGGGAKRLGYQLQLQPNNNPRDGDIYFFSLSLSLSLSGFSI